MNPAWFVQGQQLGHYIGGFTGLENGSAAPPGVYAAGFGLVEPVDSIRDANGHTVLTPDIDVGGVILAYSLTTHKRFLGGEYGLAFMTPVLNTRFTSNVFEASVESAGLSDILFEPIYLGWTKGKTDYTVNYSFYAPSGDFDPDSPLNPGLGFWEQQVQAGLTYNIDKTKHWNFSGLTTWEFMGASWGSTSSLAPSSQANTVLADTFLNTR